LAGSVALFLAKSFTIAGSPIFSYKKTRDYHSFSHSNVKIVVSSSHGNTVLYPERLLIT
jgi:hypothetical protein